MFANRARKKVKSTVLNLVNSCNDFIANEVHGQEGALTELQQEVLKIECERRILESAKHIAEGAGSGVSARFCILLQEPSLAFNPERDVINITAGTVYMMLCRALFDIYGDMRDFEELEYAISYVINATEMNLSPALQYTPKKKNKFKLLSAILALLLCVSCGYAYHTTVLLHDVESAKDIYFKECINLKKYTARAREYLGEYQQRIAYRTENGKRYHKINCPYIEGKDTHVHTIQDLENYGITACWYCYSSNFEILK